MRKLATIIGAVLLLAGIAAAGTFASLGSGDDQPVISTANPPATTRASDVRSEDRGADRRADPAKEARGRENEANEDVRGRENEANEDVRGPCDEAEHATDPRCTGTAAPAPRVDDDAADDRPAAVEDRSGSNSGHGGGVDDATSGHGGSGRDDGSRGHGGGGSDD